MTEELEIDQALAPADDPLKGAIALLRFDNPHTDTHAYALCYPTRTAGRYMGISQAGSWDKLPASAAHGTPKPTRVGAVGGMDAWSLEHGTPIDPAAFGHELVGADDLPEHEVVGLRAMGIRRARPSERRLPEGGS